MTRYILTTILFAASTLLASDAVNPASGAAVPRNEVSVAALSAQGQNTEVRQLRLAEDSFHIDDRLAGFEEAEYYSNICQTGPVWCTVPTAPVGTPCYCVVGGWTYTGYVE